MVGRFPRVCVFIVLTSFILSPQNSHAEEKNPLHGTPTFHQIERGEFLYKIALQYNCSYPALARANGIQNPNEVRAGKRLVIPSWMILPKPLDDETILINLPEFRLYHFPRDGEVKVYPICVGLTTW